MESEKVKDIKEKLQEEIFIANSFGDKLRKVPTNELENLLTLINELENENAKLMLKNSEIQTQNMGMQIKECQLKDRIADLEKEIEENAFYSKGYAQGIKNTYEVVVPNKLKQFAERFKQKCIDGGIFPAFVARKLDETLKEVIENV